MAIPQPSKLLTPVRFWPMLKLPKMLYNKVPNLLPMFKNIVFILQKLSLCSYKLTNDYNLLIVMSNHYSKEDFLNLRKFNKFILKTFSIHWVRVSFRGKGYRLRKFRKINKLTLNFGHSHWAKLLLKKYFFFKKIRRQNYMCLISGYSFFKTFRLGVKFFKKINSYTKRGLRLRKQFIQKRFGKISQVTSSLH